MKTDQPRGPAPPIEEGDTFGGETDDDLSNKGKPSLDFSETDRSNNYFLLEAENSNFTFEHSVTGLEKLPMKQLNLKRKIYLITGSNKHLFFLRLERTFPEGFRAQKKKKDPVNKNVLLFPRALVAALYNKVTLSLLGAAYQKVKANSAEAANMIGRDLSAEFSIRSFSHPYKQTYLEYCLRVSNYHISNALTFPEDDEGKFLTAQLIVYTEKKGEKKRTPYLMITTTFDDMKTLLTSEASKDWLTTHDSEVSETSVTFEVENERTPQNSQ